MCKYTFHQSSSCHRHHHSHSHSHSHKNKDKTKDRPRKSPCQWIQIAQPCYWGAGLLSCPIFASNALRIEGANVIRVKRKGCPRHDYGGLYDRNMVKMVEETRTGGSWFGPPNAKPEARKAEVKKAKKVERSDDIKLCTVM